MKRYRFTVKRAPTFRDVICNSAALLLIMAGLIYLHTL